MRARSGSILAACGIAAALAAARPDAAAQAPAAQTREARWREDLAAFAREFPAAQLDFARLFPRDGFNGSIEAIVRSIPSASDADIVLALTRLVARAHVAHTNVRLPAAGPLAFHRLPIGVQWFSDGLVLTAGSDEYRDVLGLRVASIGRLTPERLEAAVAPFIAYENDASLHHQSQSVMLVEEVLRAVGEVDSDGRVAIALARPDGSTRTLRVAPVPSMPPPALVTAVEARGIAPGPARVEPARYYRYEILPDTRTLYIRYNRCADDPRQPFAAFAAEIFAAMDKDPAAIERVVIDLRANGGGNSTVIDPLVKGLRARNTISARGRLYALVGPATFSSGLLAAIRLKDELKAIVVGEAPGEKPNSYGEVRTLTLPSSGVVVQYSTKFFRMVTNGDPPTWEPDVAARRSIADFLDGRDTVLEAALNAGKKSGNPP
jgi:hypothetical protein